MLTSLVVIGSFSERGTEPSAAWCSTRSTPCTARWQVARSRMSPSMKVKRAHCSGVTAARTSSRLCWCPVAKLSSPTTA